MKQKEKDGRKKRATEGAANGAVALIFLIIGFQLAIFTTKILERPSTAEAELQPSGAYEARTFSSERSKTPEAGRRDERGPGGAQKNENSQATPQSSGVRAARTISSERSEAPETRRSEVSPQKSKLGGYRTPATAGTTAAAIESRKARRMESFAFNPNTVTLGELVRLGLSERQAEVVLNYREKGGRFRTRADFARMYVVSDSLFERLEPFIDIPLLELNTADSAALVELRGIGPYYARRILSYRDSLGGYYTPEQLLEIRGIDSLRYAGLAESIRADSSRIRPLRLWDLPEDSLARHPYLGRQAAHSIARYRRVYAMEPLRGEHFTLEALVQENILTPERAAKLRPYCRE